MLHRIIPWIGRCRLHQNDIQSRPKTVFLFPDGGNIGGNSRSVCHKGLPVLHRIIPLKYQTFLIFHSSGWLAYT